MARTATVAYEEHQHAPGCDCAPARSYAERVRGTLDALHIPDAERAMQWGLERGYLARAEQMGLDPMLAASTLVALTARGPQEVAVALEHGGAGDDADWDALRAAEHVSYADRQNLPDSAFALPDRRALLLTDKRGKVDAGHVKAAAGRLSMMKHLGHVTKAEAAQAYARIEKAGGKVGVEVSETGPRVSFERWRGEMLGMIEVMPPSGARRLTEEEERALWRAGVTPEQAAHVAFTGGYVADCVGIHTHQPVDVAAALAAAGAPMDAAERRTITVKTARSVDKTTRMRLEESIGMKGRVVRTEPNGRVTLSWTVSSDFPDWAASIRRQLEAAGVGAEGAAAEGPHAEAALDAPPPAALPAPAAPLAPYTKELDWHRAKDGHYVAHTPMGQFTVRARTPDRRHDVLPWLVTLVTPAGSTEIGQADTKAAAYKVAAKYARKPPAPKPSACVALVDQGNGSARLERSPACVPTGQKAATPKQAYAILRERAVRSGYEEIGLLLVSVQDEAVGPPVPVATGQTTGVHYDVAQILAAAATGNAAGATSFWLYHTHPSGHAEPTGEDKDTTHTVRRACKLVLPKMKFRGHLVVGANDYSLA